MKYLTVFFSVLMLFQSCTTYKNVKAENMVESINMEGKYKVVLNNGDKFKGKILNFTEDQITLLTEKDTVLIQSNDIVKFQERKFSWWKTALVVTGVGLIVLLAISVNDAGSTVRPGSGGDWHWEWY